MQKEYTVQQAADYIGVTKHKLYKMMRAGNGPKKTKRGVYTIILIEDLKSWMNKQKI